MTTTAICGHIKVVCGQTSGKRRDGREGLVELCMITTDAPLNATEVLRALLASGLLTERHGTPKLESIN